MPQNVPLSEIPLAESPPGVTSNFVNPQTMAPAVVAVSVVMMTWAVSFVIIRLYARTQASHHLNIDDYFCIIAILLAVSNTGLIFSLNKFARHYYDIPRIWFHAAFWKLNYAEAITRGPTLFFAKGAILLLYLRIFTISTGMKYSIWLGLLWNFLLYWSSVPVATYYCTPRSGRPWDDVTVAETCANWTTYNIIQGVLSVALDIYSFILPIPRTLKLQMSRKKRLSVIGVFGTAILGITAAIVAMVYRIGLYIHKYDDASWTGASVYICISCENYVAIIVSSMPAVASVFRGKPSIPSWLARTRSRLLKSGLPISRSKDPSRTRACPSDEMVIAGHHAGDGGYLELGDGRQTDDYELVLVATGIGRAADGRESHKDGVVHKSVAVH